MKVLIVEDDDYKSEELITFLQFYSKNLEYELRKSVFSAVECVNDQVFDLVLIDMALPSHAAMAGSGAPMSLLTGGFELLFELKALERQDVCIIITQYPEIEISGHFYALQDAALAIQEHFGIRVAKLLEYTNTDDAWQKELKRVLTSL